MTDDRTTTVTRSFDSGSHEHAENAEARLILALECRQPFAPAVRLDLTRINEVVIGRGTARAWHRNGARLEITVTDHEASRRHATLIRDHDGWLLCDLGSKNGTVVNGVTVARVTLADGDVFEIGGSLFIFRDAGVGPRRVTDLDLSATPLVLLALVSLNLDVEAQAAALMKIAPSNVPVLIRGETGTGKELTAQAIHQLSARRGAFVPINCGALPRTLVESELFGSKRGAFSGARDDREGLVRRADGGTLFLDEIAELPAESQVALLRVLQDGEVRPIGSSETIRVNVRIIAATHQDLEARMKAGNFREDLYARLVGYVAHLAPLRDRREDLGTLIGTLLARATGDACNVTLQREAARALLAYPFPLNIRELEQALRTAVVLADGGDIRFEHLPETIRTYGGGGTMRPEDQALRDRLAELLREHGGNVAAVGRALGKAPIQVRRWCSRFSLDLSKFRA